MAAVKNQSHECHSGHDKLSAMSAGEVLKGKLFPLHFLLYTISYLRQIISFVSLCDNPESFPFVHVMVAHGPSNLDYEQALDLVQKDTLNIISD